ncbi:MAG: c-type cytochrome biogenesis protein CcmI [Methylotenera sp.]|nr:c-type cytochrome biogenesis protein CcmI [Methylotenera sp.]
MLAFLALVLLLIVIVLTFMVRPLLWPNSALKGDATLGKREIYRQQFDELAQDQANGMLDAAHYKVAKTELERRMLEELGVLDSVAVKAKPDRWLAFALILTVPVLAIYLYLVIGRPFAIIYPDIQAMSTQAASIQGTVSLSPALAKKVDPSATVFIYARSTQGPPMPLAIVQTTAKNLPYAYQLDDSVSIMADLKLSQAGEVVVVARVSKAGDAKPQAGDMQGISAPLMPSAGVVDVAITQVLP